METIKKALRGGLPCNEKGLLDSYHENIFQGLMPKVFCKMFLNGSGNELYTKAKAVHSSAMLAYNFFHWVLKKNRYIVIDGIKYTNVFFEVKMNVLQGTTPANMDILLVGEKRNKVHLMFIESKFLEYLESKEYELGKTYRNALKWYKSTEIEDWIPLLDEVESLVDSEKECRYKEGIKQGVSHLFALTNLSNETAFNYFIEQNNLQEAIRINSIREAEIHFINLFFEPAKHFKDDHTKFDEYKKLYEEYIKIVNDHSSIEFKIKTYSDLWKSKEIENQIKKVNNGHLHQYLNNRYMRFAEI